MIRRVAHRVLPFVRPLLPFVSVLSLVLCVATLGVGYGWYTQCVVFWYTFPAGQPGGGTRFLFSSSFGTVILGRFTIPPQYPYPPRMGWFARRFPVFTSNTPKEPLFAFKRDGSNTEFRVPGFAFGRGVNTVTGLSYSYINLSHGLLAAGFLIPPVLQVRSIRKRRRESRVGFCPVCGYDLRASPTRCPECGTVRR